MIQEETIPEPGSEKLGRLLRKGYVPSTLKEYHQMYQASVTHRDEYWKNLASRLVWDAPFTEAADEQFAQGSIRWFADGRLNAIKNTIDRAIAGGKGDNKALAFFPIEGAPVVYSYNTLKEEAVQLASAMYSRGMAAGDKAALYLPDCPETVVFMAACAYLGIVYVPIPYHFTAEIATEIVRDSDAALLLIAGESRSKSYPGRARTVSEAVGDITIIATGSDKASSYERFLEEGDKSGLQPKSCEAEHPLLLIYANSATGIPRGSVYATGGYLVQTAASFDTLFLSAKQSEPSIVCTMNLASAAGQAYGLWGPLLSGVCTVITEEGENAGASMLARVLEVYDTPALITTPRLLTTVKKELDGKKLSEKNGFSIVACCGDVLTPRLVTFAGSSLSFGAERILNLWIQSESGTAIIATLPTQELNRPGALGVPAFGITPCVINTTGAQCRTNESGQLVFSSSWPGMIRTIWEQPDRYQQLYFRRVPGHFMTNDGVRLDPDGFYWFMGRLDDVVKLRGQSLATSEIEAVLVAHEKIAEAAVVSIPGDENDSLIAFLSFEKEFADRGETEATESLEKELSDIVMARIGEFALPNRFIFARELPRTRTGKLVRRVLRRIATGDIAHDEDLSHVANPESVRDLVKNTDSES